MLALLAVLIAPFFIDWTAYRADFEREASRILGQRVVVKGDASVRLLPFPSVSFEQVEVEGAPGRPPLVTARRFEMDAELAPYLSGELRIFSMRIEAPVMNLALDGDGRLPFVPAGGALPTSAKVVLEEVAIAGGTVNVTDAASGRERTLSGIEARFAARSLAGPVTGGGTLRADGRPLAFQLATGVPAPDGPLPLKLTVDDPALLVSAGVDGTLSLAAGTPRLEGSLRAVRVDPPKPEAGASPAPVSPPRLPHFVLTGRLAGDPGGIDLADMRLSVGEGTKPYILTGGGSLKGGADPRFALDLQGEQVDIDAIAAGEGASKPEPTLRGRLGAARAVLDALPKPDLPGTIRLALPVVVAGDTTIRDLSVDASPEGAAWAVHRFQAELPGRTRVEAAGTLHPAGDANFRGSLLVAARQPSGLSEWLTGAVDPAVRTLGGAGFSARVDLSADRQRFDDMEIDIGGDTLSGRLERSTTAGDGAIDADLRGGRVDLDALVAFSRIFTGEAESVAQARRGSLKLGAGPVVYGGTTADRIDADLSYDGDVLTIARADLKGLAASDVKAKGRLTGLGGDPAGRIELGLASRDPSELIGFLSQRLPPSLALDTLQRQAPTLGPLALAGSIGTAPGAAGERPTLNVAIKGTAAKTAVSLNMALGNGIYAGGNAGRFGSELTLTSDDPGQLLGQLGVEALPIPVPAPLALTVSLSAGASGPVVANAALRAPGSELTTEGMLGLSGGGVASGEFSVALHSDDFAPWLVATGNSLGYGGLDALPVVIGGALRFDGARIALEGIEGSVGAVDMTGDLERIGADPVGGSVFFSELSLPWLARLVYGRPPGDPKGAGGWNGAAFGPSLLPDTRFAVDINTDSLDLGANATVGNASARIVASPGTIEIADIRGAVAGGFGAGSVTLRNAGGVGGFSARGDFQGLDLGGMALSGLGAPSEEEPESGSGAAPGVFGTLDASIRLDGTGQSYAGILSAMTGAGRVQVENAGFRGVPVDLLPQALRAADGAGFEATRDRVAHLVAEAAGVVPFPVPKAASDFSVVGGIARFAPVRIDRSNEAFAAEGSLSLVDLAVSGRARLELEPGDEAVEGTVPAVDYALGGTVGAPRLDADVQPLANYLGARALEREQARVEAIQGALQEKLRLRREARLYRWRDARNAAATQAAETTEQLRIERLRREERARIERESAEAQRAADAERRRTAAAAAAAERQRRAQAETRPIAPSPLGGRSLDLDTLSGGGIPQPAPNAGNPNLPGVRQPFGTPSGVGVQPF